MPSGGMSYAGTIWAEGVTVHARTALTQVDPVYLAEEPGAVVVSDRASWAAAVTGRLRDPDPVMTGAFLSLGYPLGGAIPFRGVRALRGDRGKDSRLAPAALTAAGVPFTARIHGFVTHPDVIVAAPDRPSPRPRAHRHRACRALVRPARCHTGRLFFGERRGGPVPGVPGVTCCPAAPGRARFRPAAAGTM
ncbi:MAG TPA: hypothetical protein VFW50_02030 [Streptosporangiaceae bacterium]|nr:hypothetical protein [Streptosporangiaceae bacterium]